MNRPAIDDLLGEQNLSNFDSKKFFLFLTYINIMYKNMLNVKYVNEDEVPLNPKL